MVIKTILNSGFSLSLGPGRQCDRVEQSPSLVSEVRGRNKLALSEATESRELPYIQQYVQHILTDGEERERRESSRMTKISALAVGWMELTFLGSRKGRRKSWIYLFVVSGGEYAVLRFLSLKFLRQFKQK